MRGTTLKAVAGAITLVLVTAGCSSSNPTPGGGESTYVVSFSLGEPQFLLPTNVNESSGNQVLSALFAPLVDFDDKAKPYEVAADSITTTDNKVWTIKLKAGWTFHNGEPVTSDSFINAWNYGAYGPNGQNNNYFFEQIEGYAALNPADPDGSGPAKPPVPATQTLSGLKKVDDTTFTVTLSEPFSEWKAVMGYSAFYPLPAGAFSSPGVINESYQQAPIGNGPFKMKGTWQHDSKIEVERWDGYQGTKPKIGGVTFKIYQDLDAAYADLQADNLDVLNTIPTSQLANAAGDLGDRFQHSPASTFQFVAFPTYDPQFAKADVRRAISMAINRDEIIDRVFKNSQTSADAFVSPVVAGYRKGACGEACTYNPTKAKQLYTAAGGPASLKLSYNADGGHKEWVDATCNQIKASLGVECVGAPEPKFADLLTKLRAKQAVGFFRLGWSMDYPSMQNYLGPLYSTAVRRTTTATAIPSSTSWSRTARRAHAEEAIKKYQQAEDILVRDMPVIPLRFGQNNYGHSTKVTNVVFDLFSRVDFNKIEAAAA
jgi:ABC-type oligopeptide transport system substrate-binding subunit